MLRCCTVTLCPWALRRAELETPFSTGAAATRATWIARFMPRPCVELTARVPGGGRLAADMPHSKPQATEAPPTTAAMIQACRVVKLLPGKDGAACGAGAGAGVGSAGRELEAPASSSVVAPASVIIKAPV